MPNKGRETPSPLKHRVTATRNHISLVPPTLSVTEGRTQTEVQYFKHLKPHRYCCVLQRIDFPSTESHNNIQQLLAAENLSTGEEHKHNEVLVLQITALIYSPPSRRQMKLPCLVADAWPYLAHPSTWRRLAAPRRRPGYTERLGGLLQHRSCRLEPRARERSGRRQAAIARWCL